MECCATERDQRPRDMSKVKSRLETILDLMSRKQGSAASAADG